MTSMGDLVQVWATADHFEGELLRSRLEADDISVLLKGDGEGPYRAGPVYLFVSSEDETRARALLDAIASGAFATSDEDVDEPAEPETSS
jgi:hypothetical protein